jgi:uncharacterized repeat protein (TIGR03803 family)
MLEDPESTVKHSFSWFFALAAVLSVTGAAVATAQTEAIIHAFQTSNKYDGANPGSGVVADGSGALYGTTVAGGKSAFGTVYKLAPPTQVGGAWKQNILYSFTGADGQFPAGSLLLTKNHTIFGTTLYTSSSYGSVFELVPPSSQGAAWTEAVLHSFSGGVDGGEPDSGVIMDNLGRLYGTTQLGGKEKVGVVFQMTPPSKSGGSWTERVLYNFTGGSDGAAPTGLIFDNTGALYGTATGGGDIVCINNSGCGTVFKLSPPSSGSGAWTESVLYSFSGSIDGAFPSAGLIFDSTGALYGTTGAGGDLSCNSGRGCGTVFKLTPPSTQGGSWTESVLYVFTGGSDGFQPEASLVFDTTGALYGTTTYGGAGCDCGIAFKLTPAAGGSGPWTETILHTFTGVNDGSYPVAPLLLVQTSIYGTTNAGTGNCPGGRGCGIVFEIMQ